MHTVVQSDFLQATGWAILNSLWQMAILWVVYQMLISVFRVSRPSFRSGLATGLLFTGFAWFVSSFCLIYFTATSESIAHHGLGVITVSHNASVNDWLYRLLPYASLVYLLMLFIPVFHFIRNYRYAAALRQQQLSRIDVDFRLFVDQVAQRMGITRKVQVWVSGLISSPVTLGYLKPVILLPMASITQLSTHQIEAILLHELAHIRRMDYLINLLIRVVHTVLYFNPFVKAFLQIIEREREKDCDRLVMQFQYSPQDYALALLTLERATGMASAQLAVAAFGKKKNELLHRVESILGLARPARFSWQQFAGILAGLLCFIALNVILIAGRPGFSAAMASLRVMGLPVYTTPSTQDEGVMPIAYTTEELPQQIVTTAPQDDVTETSASEEEPIEGTIEINPFRFAGNQILDKEAQAEVDKAMAMSKKVLEETSWKNVERMIGDAMTSEQKAKAKEAYLASVDKINWDKMEFKLRDAYDKINWDMVNDNLNTAITQIKLDSARVAYDIALSGLNELQAELKASGNTRVPDTEITLKTIEAKQRAIRARADSIRTTRPRKVIAL